MDKLSQSRRLWDTRSCTSSKQSPHATFYRIGKNPLCFLAFPPLHKSGGLSGAPESRKTLRGKGVTERKVTVCESKRNISESCDAAEWRSLFYSKKAYKKEKLQLFEVFLRFSHNIYFLCLYFFKKSVFLRSGLFLQPLFFCMLMG